MIAYTNYSVDGRVRFEAESLAQWGYEVTFLVAQEGAEAHTYSQHGVMVRELPVRSYGGRSHVQYLIAYFAFLLLAFLMCTRLFVTSRMSVVHVHNMPDVLIFAGLIPRLFGCTLILDVHDTVPETYVAKFGALSPLTAMLLRLEEAICFRLADRLICVNDVQRDVLLERGISPDKITVITYIPNFLCNAPPSTGMSPASPAFRMVNHGTIARRLGIDLIVQAAARLIHQIPNFELHLYGAGDELTNVLRQVKMSGLSDYVHFHGMVPWETLATELRNMDVGIVANRANVATELMLPIKLIDYVSLDIPAIVPRLRAIQYYFSTEMVTFFEPGNVDSMVEATLRLYHDEPRRRRQSENARSFLSKYGSENGQERLKSFYQSISAIRGVSSPKKQMSASTL